MGRSIIMRDIGDDFAKFFIAIGRIKEELQLYELNEEKINSFLNENPGLLGGAAQTILKRSRAEGDAYRQIQEIMINEDGSYVSHDKFIAKMAENKTIPQEIKDEIMLLKPENNVGYANELMKTAIESAEKTIKLLQEKYH